MCIRPLRGGFRYTASVWMLPIQTLSAEAGAGGRMWLEASRLARGDCAEPGNPFPPPTPGDHSLQRQQKCFLSIPSLILGKRGQARLYICLGAGAGAILTHKGIISIELHPSSLMPKIHIGKGCALCRRPRENKLPSNSSSRSSSGLSSTSTST